MEEARDGGIFVIKFGGGEPLLVPEIWQYVDYCASFGIGSSITTNGRRITEVDLEGISKYPVKISVSVDGGPSVHDRIRGGGSYERALRALRLIQLTGKRPAIQFTLMKSNL